MIVCSKKDSKPRRTVDFQQLNKHALRETHSTPTPYNRGVRSVALGPFVALLLKSVALEEIPTKSLKKSFKMPQSRVFYHY